MTPATAIKTCLAKSFQFSGRASRAEFWWFALAWPLIAFPFNGLVGKLFSSTERFLIGGIAQSNILLTALASLPLHAAASRRVHDTNDTRSTWPIYVPVAIVLCFEAYGIYAIARNYPDAGDLIIWRQILFGFPIGAIALFFVGLSLLMPSQPGTNQYGPNPNEVSP